MQTKEAKETGKSPAPCPKCGGRARVSQIPANADNLRFIHVRRKCLLCGEWLGGKTYKNKAKEEVER